MTLFNQERKTFHSLIKQISHLTAEQNYKNTKKRNITVKIYVMFCTKLWTPWDILCPHVESPYHNYLRHWDAVVLVYTAAVRPRVLNVDPCAMRYFYSWRTKLCVLAGCAWWIRFELRKLWRRTSTYAGTTDMTVRQEVSRIQEV